MPLGDLLPSFVQLSCSQSKTKWFFLSVDYESGIRPYRGIRIHHLHLLFELHIAGLKDQPP